MMNKLSSIVMNVGKSLIEWRKLGINGHWEGSQFKADADIRAHNALVEALSKLIPNITIISEEEPDSQIAKRPNVYWLIDPIDGTASYAKGYPGFVTQVALVKNNRPILAAIYAPAIDSLYIAEKGCGAFLNGKRLLIQKNKTIKTLIDNYPEPRGIAEQVYNEFNFGNYVECGSISLKICKIADGTADVFLKDIIVRDWDVAAPHLILEEAGGYLFDINGKVFDYIGKYSYFGIVASKSLNDCSQIVHWYKERNGKDESL